MKRLLFTLTLFVFFIFELNSQTPVDIASWPLTSDLNGIANYPGITVHPVVLGSGVANTGHISPGTWCGGGGCSGLQTNNWTSVVSLNPGTAGGAWATNHFIEFSFTLNAGQPDLQISSFKFNVSAGFTSNCTGNAGFAVRYNIGPTWTGNGTHIGQPSGPCSYETGWINNGTAGACTSYNIDASYNVCGTQFPITLTAGQRIRFRIYIGTTRDNTTWRVLFGNVSFERISPLAVTLNSFNANCEHNGTDINWSTASEQNASHFDLERSRDGETWDHVTTVLANGNSNSLKTYSVTDNARLADDYYYRLHQVDFDGTDEIYGPITVNCGGELTNSLLVFPNPSSGEFAVEINSNEVLEEAAVVVYNISGKQLLRQDMSSKLKGTNMVYFTDNNLAAGTYLVVIESETKNNFTPVKLVIR